MSILFTFVDYSNCSQAEKVHKSTTEAPGELNLSLTHGTQAVHQPRQHQPLPPPSGPYPYPYYPPPPPHTYPYFPPPPPAPTAPQQSPVRKPKPTTGIDSEEEESPTLYPLIEEWLTELDSGERGQDKQNFAQYGPALRESGYIRLKQLEDEKDDGVKMLMEVCDGLPTGTAKLIMKYVLKDCRKIRRVDAERKAAWAA